MSRQRLNSYENLPISKAEKAKNTLAIIAKTIGPKSKTNSKKHIQQDCAAIERLPEFSSNLETVKAALRQTIDHANQKLKHNEDQRIGARSGSTAVVSVLFAYEGQAYLVVANTGDSWLKAFDLDKKKNGFQR